MPKIIESAFKEVGNNREYIQSLARGLAVIRAFTPTKTTMTLSEVADSTGMSRAAARRFLLTLVDLGYVNQVNRDFSLASKVLSLSYAYLTSMNAWELVYPRMKALSEKIHESCSLAVLDDEEIVYVARIPTNRVMCITLNVGSRLPAYCTAMGRVLLSSYGDDEIMRRLNNMDIKKLTKHTCTNKKELLRNIQQVKVDEYSVIDQELEIGLCSVAVPIVNGVGDIIASLNVGGSSNRITKSDIKRKILPCLNTAAREIRPHIMLQN